MSVDNPFSGVGALVTGGGEGLGRGLVKALHARGAVVYALDHNQNSLKSLEEECPGVKTHLVDCADWDATRNLVTSLENVRLLVNNVGCTRRAYFLEATKEEIDESINTNVLPVINISQVIAKDMIAKGHSGSIVNVCSLGTRAPFPLSSVYSMTKSAVERMTKCMAKELGPHKIRVNSVHPILMNTPSFAYVFKDPIVNEPFREKVAVGRFAEVDDVVQPILMLLDETKSAMITGTKLDVDGGYD